MGQATSLTIGQGLYSPYQIQNTNHDGSQPSPSKVDSKGNPDIQKNENAVAPDADGFETISLSESDLRECKETDLSQANSKDAPETKTFVGLLENASKIDSSIATKIKSAIGRFFQTICNPFKRLFAPKPESIQSDPNRAAKFPLSDSEKANFFSPEARSGNKDAVEFNKGHIALALTGDPQGIDVTQSGSINSCEDLWKDGGPKLSDIKQNPARQDCWFLSALGSVLQTQGANYIKDLFSEHKGDNSNCVDVTLRVGTDDYKTYTVPLGDIKINGSPAYSNSAKWVQVLECAMHMRMIDQQEQIFNGNTLALNTEYMANQVKMDNRGPHEAFFALLPSRVATETIVNTGKETTTEQRANILKRALAERRPVTLNKTTRSGFLGKLMSAFSSLKLDVAMQHAITPYEYDENNKSFKYYDPYGRTGTIPESYMDSFSVTVTGLNGDMSWKNPNYNQENISKYPYLDENAPIRD